MVAAMFGTVFGAALVTNGSFEDGAPGGIPTGWTHQPGNARSEIYLIDNIATDGRQALFIKNASPWKPNTYSSVSQQLPLKPNVRYRLSCSIKGEGVRRLVFVLGDRWQIRFSPKVTEGWKKHEFEFTLQPQDIRAGTAMLRILTEDVTEGAWIDQVDIQPVGGAALAPSEFQPELLLTAKRLTTPLNSLKGIPAGLATVTLPADRNSYTGKTLPSPDQFRAELALAYDDKGVIFLAEVRKKDVRGGSGANMWSFDSIQIGVSPECSFSEKREPGDLEIGFSPLPTGVADYCWTLNRSLNSKEVELRGGPTATGYFIAARLNWELFRNSGFRDADAFSFNAIVNINTDGIREVAFLQPGIHDGKSKKRNTLVLFERERPTGFFRAVSRRSPTELTGSVYLTGLEMPENWELPVELTDGRGEKTAVPLSNMPAVKRDMIVVRDVRLPLTRMAEGAFGISFPVGGSRISGGTAEKVDLFARQQAELKALRERFFRANAAVKESGLEHPYLAMYNAVIGRLLAKQESYLNRDQSPEAREYYLTLGERVDRDLSLAQDEFDALIAKLRSGEKVPFTMEANPVFFAGYGHFDDVIRDIPFMQKVGANLIQFETGPSKFLKEGKNGEFIADPAEFRNRIEPALKAAQENHVKIALLLSPHYHPRWWLEAHPKLKRGNGLTHYEVNAPEARRMLNAYLDCLLPLLRDSRYRDALHSIVTTNEPNYAGANWSNPMTRAFFREWCEKRYGTIGAFNAATGRKFKSFAELADTDPAGDPAVNYAFEIFRRTSFADFHRFLADKVKQYLPDMPVSSKIMIGTTWLPMGVNFAVDPELFAEISDFNGNDAGMVYKADRWISAWRAINLSHDLQYSLQIGRAHV